jgi:hypothetical protein
VADEQSDEVRPRRALVEETASDAPYKPRRALDPEDDPADKSRRQQRSKRAVVVGAVAALAAAGLATGYGVLTGPKAAGAGPEPAASASAAASTSSPNAEPTQLTDAMAMSPEQAKEVDPDRSWRVALTQRALDDQSPQAVCLDSADAQGASQRVAAPQQSVVRVLSSSGQQPPGLFHQADAYATVQEARRAYEVRAKALGGCATPGAYLESGYRVTGLGDQAVAAVVRVTTDTGSSEQRSVVLNRTGRLVNVADVAQTGAAVAVAKVAEALAGVTTAQCGAADGRCSAAVTVTAGPPPPGGGQPGFLVGADLPAVTGADTTWNPTVPAPPAADFAGSGCERVNWAKTAARHRAARTYLHGDPAVPFGLDEIVLTHASDSAARGLVAQVKADLDSCAKRKLTASVTPPSPVSGVGADGASVRGWTSTVKQQTTAGVHTYRVGVVSAGKASVFTFLNPQPKLDLTDAQWAAVTVRAGQRASQVP